MTSQPIVSPEDQSVTFVELFFDLVFVFSVTQVVRLLVHELSLLGAFQGVLIFWLVWWAWTQFTWTLNSANTLHDGVELVTLGATAIAFFMAASIPQVFGGHAMAFAVPYVLVRSLGLAMHYVVSNSSDEQHQAVRSFATLSLAGLIAVLCGAALGGTAVYWGFGAAIGLDVLAAVKAGDSAGWSLRPEHFSERHGLFTIIALGESLIVAANGMSGATWTAELVGVAALAALLVCALWWTYFPRTKPILEHALCSKSDAERSSLGRDVFSLAHFPMLCGVIAVSAGIEGALHHPHGPLSRDFALCLGVGLLLFVGAMTLAVLRATGTAPRARLVLIPIAAAAIVLLDSAPVQVSLGIALVPTVIVAWIEQRCPLPSSKHSSGAQALG